MCLLRFRTERETTPRRPAENQAHSQRRRDCSSDHEVAGIMINDRSGRSCQILARTLEKGVRRALARLEHAGDLARPPAEYVCDQQRCASRGLLVRRAAAKLGQALPRRFLRVLQRQVDKSLKNMDSPTYLAGIWARKRRRTPSEFASSIDDRTHEGDQEGIAAIGSSNCAPMTDRGAVTHPRGHRIGDATDALRRLRCVAFRVQSGTPRNQKRKGS